MAWLCCMELNIRWSTTKSPSYSFENPREYRRKEVLDSIDGVSKSRCSRLLTTKPWLPMLQGTERRTRKRDYQCHTCAAD